MNRSELLILLADAAVTVAGAWVGMTQDELVSVFGFCFAGGGLGGTIAILVGKERTPPRELAKRWVCNLLAALMGGPFAAYYAVHYIVADRVPMPIVAFTCGAALGVIGVSLLLFAQVCTRLFLNNHREKLTRLLRKGRQDRRAQQQQRSKLP